MANVYKDKKDMVTSVMKIIESNFGADSDVLVSTLSIRFGYSHPFITRLLEDMVKVGKIRVDKDNYVTKGKKE